MSDISYLALDPAIEGAIREQRNSGKPNPHAFRDEDVVRRSPRDHDRATLVRPAFERDIEKIINIPAYNRYADKTQVFSFVENDDICRRALHVQLVARVARSISSLLGLNVSLTEAIALGHDLGHTPFGHAGEKFLSTCYHARTGRFFNHNVQSVRVMDRLYRRNISLQTLDGALCHNGEFAKQELSVGNLGSFDQLDELVESCIVDQTVIASLRPSTLEGCVVRMADMIAYLGKDRIDALDMGVIDSFDAFESNYIGRSNVMILNNMIVDIVNHSFGRDRISMSPEAFRDIKRAKEQNYALIYRREGMSDAHADMMQEMFEELYEKLLGDLRRKDESSPVFRHHVGYLARKSHSITRESYLREDPDTIVVDYISSMTDSYFSALYAHLFPNSDKRVVTRTYTDDLR
ncbi:deoxyguanosinetriphosphate triphosphohydrolase family protein [Gordonibacter sp. Marseille-P4307]|uniref:deoxyguanosinetriphosphate triphosphohydrolase family protein n=1 Tax=Gordonibacter sp. Marseille-P4307 TaxID=2161815 RepID=UPI000F51CD88|nr:HD domain-containing protein [Gordonibacter sp. Marseille-P4307]